MEVSTCGILFYKLWVNLCIYLSLQFSVWKSYGLTSLTDISRVFFWVSPVSQWLSAMLWELDSSSLPVIQDQASAAWRRCWTHVQECPDPGRIEKWKRLQYAHAPPGVLSLSGEQTYLMASIHALWQLKLKKKNFFNVLKYFLLDQLFTC